MNNAFSIEENLSDKESLDRKPMLRARETNLSALIEALDQIANSSYWHTIQREVFAKETSAIIKRLQNETDTAELFRLQGQVAWSRFLDLPALANSYRRELEGIRKQLPSS